MVGVREQGGTAPRPTARGRGLTSHHACSWLTVDDGTAAEEHGEVRPTAPSWSGSWRITVHRKPIGRTTMTGGFGHEGLVNVGPVSHLNPAAGYGRWPRAVELLRELALAPSPFPPG
ncbi:glycoside hydrolase family 36 N-terminal domain-containing protein [Streptomyces sp. NPDC093097]|uniref:glycoside hydrolase family 36 N-terminal domain-containing protein n=1 Tax=Streptomyces sp. NPDC093097 TaxID=3366027 RepID=UPI00380BA0B1